MNKNITMSINVIFMGILMTIMSNFSVLRFIDSFYSCITTCLCQVNIHPMFDKWKPLFLFLSEMIFVTFQNTFIAQTSKCFKGEQTRLTNNLSRFNYEGAVVLLERKCTYICCWRPYNTSILSAMYIGWNFSSSKISLALLRSRHRTLNEVDLSLSTTIYECSHLPCIQICQKGKCFKNEHGEQQNE